MDPTQVFTQEKLNHMINTIVLFLNIVGLPSSLVEAEERRRKSSESSMSGGNELYYLIYCQNTTLFHLQLKVRVQYRYYLSTLFQETPQKGVPQLHQQWVLQEVETSHLAEVGCCLHQVVLSQEETSFIKELRVSCNRSAVFQLLF